MHKRLAVVSTVLIVVLALAGGDAAARDSSIRGSGQLVTKELDLAAFGKLDVGGAFDVHVEFGGSQRVALTIDDNLVENMEIEVHGDTLNLDYHKNCNPSRGSLVEITVPDLEGVAVHGAGDVEIEDFNGDRFEFKLSGAGDLTIDGQVDELEVRISGAGDVDARELIARDADVHISGAGDAKIHVTDRLRGRISGVGNLDYYGDPAETDNHVSGMGNIERK